MADGSRRRFNWKRLRRIAVFSVLSLAVLVAVMPFALYIPAVQERVTAFVVEKVRESAGYDVSVGSFLLKFPLKVAVDDFCVAEAEGDTMVSGGRVVVDVRVLPLLMGDLIVRNVDLEDVGYRMTSSDSSLTLSAKIGKFTLKDSKIELLTNYMNLQDAVIDGADVDITIDPRKAKPEAADTSSQPAKLLIDLRKAKLRNVGYRMRMMPEIDSLYARIGDGELKGVSLNLTANMVRLRSLTVDSLSASYFKPSAGALKEFLAEGYKNEADTLDKGGSAVWTVIADSLHVGNSNAVYAVKGTVPKPGFDMDYISLSGVGIDLGRLYSRGTRLRVPVRRISAVERCGISLDSLSGLFEINDSMILADNIKLRTLMSEIRLNARIGNDFLSGKRDGKVSVDMVSDISLEEAGKALPELRGALRGISRVENLKSEIKAAGTAEKVDIEKLSLKINRIADVSVTGYVRNAFDGSNAEAHARLRGQLTGGNVVKPVVGLGESVNIPVVRLNGDATYKKDNLRAWLDARVDTGKVLMRGAWNIGRKGYSGSVDLRGFDFRSIMPAGNLASVTGRVTADGRGYDIYSMKLRTDVAVERIAIGGNELRNIDLSLSTDGGVYEAYVQAADERAAFDLSLSGNMSRERYDADVDGNVYRVDLSAFQPDARTLTGGLGISGHVRANVADSVYAGFLRLSDIDFTYGSGSLRADSIDVGALLDSDNLRLRLRNKDLRMRFSSAYGLGAWSRAVAGMMPMVDTMLLRQRLDLLAVKRALPAFDFEMTAGTDNLVCQYLGTSGIKFSGMDLTVKKDTDIGLQSRLSGLVAGGVEMDTVSLACATLADSLSYDLHVGNRVENTALLKTADLAGVLSGNRVTAYLKQADKAGEQGFDFGINAAIADSVVTASIYPENPLIAFRKWTLNSDNFVTYSLSDKSVVADLDIKSGDNSRIKIYTDNHSVNNGINVDLAGIELKDWLTLSPFSPPVAGELSSNLKLYYNNKYMWGSGEVNVAGMRYGKNRLGDIGLKTRAAYVDDEQNVYAQMYLDVDGRQIVAVRGHLNDSTGYDMDMEMRRFPLSLSNAFLPDGMASADGYLNAAVDLKGTAGKPDIRGYLQFDSTSVVLPDFGAKFRFDTAHIAVDNGVIAFNRYKLYGVNGNPIVIDGDVHALPADKMRMNLSMTGNNVQIVDSKKSGRAELYGRGFVDLKSRISGYLSELDMSASVSVLSGSNLTYVMQESANEIVESADDNVVKFVSFNDTTTVADAAADTVVKPPFAMKIDGALTLHPNAVFTVNLSPDGKNKVQINGEGQLDYSQTYQGDMRLTGRYVISSGFVRYSPPMLSEKLFNFKEGSSVVWTGELLDPTIDVKAVETVKANVNTNQNSRLVPFDVALNVGNTLSRLDVSFDLSTEADMTVANELSTMTKEQRAQQAMNLLLYGSYTGLSTTTNSNISGENMAYSFLESTLNKWAANNISGVDLSFGINQYDKTVDGSTSTATSYSYQVSKSVFDDRFKIVVGGNYSTDDSAGDNLSQNLVNDISFEYKLNKAGTSYVKLFRHNEYESILEGEITETGGGFVWKRKIASWRDMFKLFKKLRRPRKAKPAGGSRAPQTDSAAQWNFEDESR